MASGLGVSEQLGFMMDVLKRCDHSNISQCLNGQVSLMSLVYPLLPTLPLQPSPTLLDELLRENNTASEEKCDMCGRVGKNFISCCCSPNCLSETDQTQHVGQKRSSIDKMMEVIEQKINETLHNIEETTGRYEELNRQIKQFNESDKPVMTDAQLLERLKSLVKEKTKLENRVKALEYQEHKIKESLIYEFELIKPIHTGKNKPESEKLARLNEGEQIPTGQHNSQNKINLEQSFNIATLKKKEGTDEQDFLEKNKNYSQEKPEKGIDVAIEQQYFVEKGTSEEYMYPGNSEEYDSESEIIIINYNNPVDEELSEISTKSPL